jgi:hypothetical protein
MCGCFSFLSSLFRGKADTYKEKGILFAQGTDSTFITTDEVCFRGMDRQYQNNQNHEPIGQPMVFLNGGTTNMVSTSRSLQQAFGFGRAVSKGSGNIYVYAMMVRANQGVDCASTADKDVVTQEQEVALKRLPWDDIIGYRVADSDMTFTQEPVYLNGWEARVPDLRDHPNYGTLRIWQRGDTCRGH